ncbi:nitroreductase/quinone reductase family protein [Thermomonospora umbrina]|uniref:Deazaflavin-dependent oxidoreductase (Nitroreductase family) n=1 Tax=Thermomonospora umbrina TaxID=111806 RepID=A0A3D9SQL2_9ACTN|nr:nitroreductase/quinone reductase family protein [Thermomonospora umbrina]REE96263.1 deazaflavin-dependent oxidoreductase (nitroreductase family) [Thermomonospora umbrina]
MGWNERVIKEFRENNGKVGGRFEGAPLLLLTTAGRKTGKPHTNPVIHLRDGDRHLVFASNAGSDEHPDWYHNLVAAPQVTIEIGTDEGRVEPVGAQAVVLEGEERDRWWERQCEIDPSFREYERQTTRTIPVVALNVLDLSADPQRSRMIAEQLGKLHAGLRAELTAVRERLDRAVAGDAASAAGPDLVEQLRRHCLTYCHNLQMHHIREDGAFTAFERLFPDLAPVIARLREEHATIERILEGFEAFLGRDGSDPAQVRAELERVVADLEAHFAYEEEQLLAATEHV